MLALITDTEKFVINIITIIKMMFGFLLFLLPLSLGFVPVMLSASVVIAVALFAAVEETVLLWRGKGEK